MEKNIEFIGEELFNKIRSRFPKVTLGDEKGQVTNDPKTARFFDFNFNEAGNELATISVSINKESLDIVYSNSFLEDQGEIAKNNWFSFLKELRQFAKKRLLNFDVRNITKSNLDKRDYGFMAQQNFRESTMTESRLYGTAKNSFQNIGSAKIHIKHSHPVNNEITNGRTQYIESIFIENDDGERFKYPYRHLNGARAAARHIAEGGNMYDDFGKYITGLSEELNHLRKFKVYVNKNSFMAENMSPYMNTIVERMNSIRKNLISIQRPSTYRAMAENYIPDEMVSVPEDVSKNWIDKLTIKQFNEELQDVFPYIYKLISESSLVTEINPNDIDYAEETTVQPKSQKYSKVDEFDNWASDLVSNALESEHNKKPDEDGDGVPDWADKKPGEDDNANKDDEAEKAKARRRHLANISRTRAGGSKGRSKKVDDSLHSHEEQKIPVTEFVLSMYDRESGRFPKGETSVLTGVEKEYGEQYVRTAEAFINAINEKFAEYHTRDRGEFIQPEQGNLNDILRLSGLG